jgi:hypothetical protein
MRSIAIGYLTVMLIIPLLVIMQDAFQQGLGEFWRQVTLPAATHAMSLTLWTSAVMTAINTVMGVLTAFVLVRFNFPGKRILNGIIDLPLAIPTLVTGVMLVILFGPQETLGAWLKNQFDISIIFAPPGIILTGEWRDGEPGHNGEGRAQILRDTSGSLFLRLEEFSVTNGPDLFVVLSPDADGYADGSLNLGGLKATDGNINYEIPTGTDLTQFQSAVIWCRGFDVTFAVATLEAP